MRNVIPLLMLLPVTCNTLYILGVMLDSSIGKSVNHLPANLTDVQVPGCERINHSGRMIIITSCEHLKIETDGKFFLTPRFNCCNFLFDLHMELFRFSCYTRNPRLDTLPRRGQLADFRDHVDIPGILSSVKIW